MFVAKMKYLDWEKMATLPEAEFPPLERSFHGNYLKGEMSLKKYSYAFLFY